MKRNILPAITLSLSLLLTTGTGFAQKYQNGVIDKTVALVGGEMIQLSTIEAEVQMMLFNGVTNDKNIRCEVLENLLTQKLFLTQARLDSLTVNNESVEQELSNRVQRAMQNLGGEKAMEEYFKKPLFKIKQEWRETLAEQSLTQQMQSRVVQTAPELTPSDVEKYYKKASKDSLPIISTQYMIRQIVIYPDKEQAALQIREKLLGLRERILKGEKFSTLATIYSQDPSSAVRGGELGMMGKQMLWPAFSDAAMALKPGQVSQIVETPDGFHIIQLIKREGDMFNARHILIRPAYTSIDRQKAFSRLDSLKTLITKDSLPFDVVARGFSQDPATFLNGGAVADDRTGSLLIAKDELKDFEYIKDLKEGEISDPFESVDKEGNLGNTLYKIVKIDKIIPSHTANIKDDFNVLYNMAKEHLAQEAISRFIKEKQAATYIKIDPMFANCPFKEEGWFKQ